MLNFVTNKTEYLPEIHSGNVQSTYYVVGLELVREGVSKILLGEFDGSIRSNSKNFNPIKENFKYIYLEKKIFFLPISCNLAMLLLFKLCLMWCFY
jgi:hypothetical protein